MRKNKGSLSAPKKGKTPVPQRDKIEANFNIKEWPWTEKQQQLIDLALSKENKIIICNGPPGVGKAQPVDSLVLTSDGWKKIGDISSGDFVFSQDGLETQVIATFPQGEKDVYKISFSDGTSTECCLDHLWATLDHEERNHRIRVKGQRKQNKRKKTSKPYSVKTTEHIKKTLFANHHGLNHSVPLCEPVRFAEKSLPINPYVLGIILGDGGIFQGSVCVSSCDKEIVDRFSELIGDNLMLVQTSDPITYRIIMKNKGIFKKNPLKEKLKKLNLMGKKSHEKFIPDIFKFNSIENRIELLRGLMDSDGTVSNHHVSFCSTSKSLAQDVIFLVESLGGTAKIKEKENYYTYKGDKKKGRNSFNVHVKLPNAINPFSLKRKREKVIHASKYPPRRYISAVDCVGKKECVCILVENDSHLYLTNNFIVTHNTLVSVYCCLLLLNQKRISNILYYRNPIESASKSLGFLKGDYLEKISPYGEPLNDHLVELLDKASIDKLYKDKRVSVESIGFAKGRSHHVQGIICDEAEDLTPQELELIMGRMGKYSKLFIIGDRRQANIKHSGFIKVLEMFNDEEARSNGIVTFGFDKSDCLRNPVLHFIVERFEKIYAEYRNGNGR